MYNPSKDLHNLTPAQESESVTQYLKTFLTEDQSYYVRDMRLKLANTDSEVEVIHIRRESMDRLSALEAALNTSASRRQGIITRMFLNRSAARSMVISSFFSLFGAIAFAPSFITSTASEKLANTADGKLVTHMKAARAGYRTLIDLADRKLREMESDKKIKKMNASMPAVASIAGAALKK